MKSKSTTPRRLQLAAALALSAFATSTGSAVDFNFNVASGDWNAAGSWTPAGPPAGGGGNFAYVNNGGTATITANIPAIQDPFIGRGIGNSGTVNHSAGVANFSAGWMFIGDNGGTGTYNLTGPGNTLGSGDLTTGRIYLGGLRGAGTPGGNGTMSVNTTGTLTAGNDLSVGARGGTGNLTITAGTVNANTWFIIGESDGGVGGGTGTVVQNGGNVTGGATDAGGRFWIGSNEGGAAVPTTKGFYTINSGNLTVRNAIIGKNYEGTFTQNNGTVTINNAATDSRLGEAGGSKGIYNMNNGLLTMGANFHIGASGMGIFTQTGGTVNASNFPVVGRFVGGTGTLGVSGGSFNQTGAAQQLIIGEEGTGTLTISGTGAVNVANIVSLGTTATGNGTVNLNGGTLFTNNVTRGGAGAAQLNFNGGILKAASNQAEVLPNFNTATTEILAGGAVIDSNGFGITTAVALDGVGGLTKQGLGSLTLTGASTYTGTTLVANGTLVLTGSIASSALICVGPLGTFDVSGVGGGFNLFSGQTLGGKGTVLGKVTPLAGSFLDLGKSVGTLTFASDLDISLEVAGLATASLRYELDTPGASDLALLTGGILNIGTGSLEFDDFAFTALGGFGPGTYTLFDTSNLVAGSLGTSVTGTIAGNGATLFISGDGQDVQLNVVPEPSALVSLAGGIAMLVGFQRRRRA